MNKKTKILIVDDRPENLLTLESILAEDHRTFISATSGREALLMTSLEEFDLIMLDYRLDDMTGIDVAESLRANSTTAHIPILLVTALTKRESPSLNHFEKETIDIIHKPLDFEIARNKTSQFEKLSLERKNEKQLKKSFPEN